MVNSVKFWTIDDFEISSYKFHLSEKINNTFTTSGSDNSGKCSYAYNELGFRGDSIHKNGFKIMCIGDSNTEGVGVNNEETWPSQFCNLIPNGVNMNFGMGGRSNDYISRCLLTYYDLIKPDLVLIMYTSPQRREIYTESGGIEPYMSTVSWGYLSETKEGREIQSFNQHLQNDNEDFINWYKNHLLIKYFLESKKCNWLWNGWMEIPKEYVEFNRFDGQYGDFIDKGADGFHSGRAHNNLYANNLFNYVYKNFKNYLPNNIV
jgi:hypothetical protein